MEPCRILRHTLYSATDRNENKLSNNQLVAPVSWDEFVGQQRVKDRLQISIRAAERDGRQMGSVLLITEPGYGKSTLARLIATEMGVELKSLMMPVSPKVLMKSLLDHEGVLFIDEIHRLPKGRQEEFLLAMEEGCIQMANGEQRPIASNQTIVAATTEPHQLIKPLMDRFVHKPTFEQYSDDEMRQIVQGMFSKIGMKVTKTQAEALGRASAGTPRQARTITFMARDLQTTNPSEVLGTLGITGDGLTEDHVKYLTALERLDGQAGIELLSSHTTFPKVILFDLEKLLVRKNYIYLAPKGRALTLKGSEAVKELLG